MGPAKASSEADSLMIPKTTCLACALGATKELTAEEKLLFVVSWSKVAESFKLLEAEEL